MRPSAAELLIGASSALQTEPPEEEVAAFAQAKRGATALVLALLAQEVESGAAVRAIENQGMRALFAEAAQGAWIPRLGPDLARAAQSREEGLTLSALDAANAALRRLLIELHEAVERSPNPQSPERERAILRLLRDGAARRLLVLPAPAEPSA